MKMKKKYTKPNKRTWLPYAFRAKINIAKLVRHTEQIKR